MSGEETELDKSVIEEIGDPLVHIIRNSCDHGIETPEARIAKGKPAKGTVALAPARKAPISSSGSRTTARGLMLHAIRDKAVERGLTTRADVDRMSDKEVFRYIFEAGLSTAKVVSDVSGRGVGMDVVRTNIEKLNGMIELDSAKRSGDHDHDQAAAHPGHYTGTADRIRRGSLYSAALFGCRDGQDAAVGHLLYQPAARSCDCVTRSSR